MKNLHLVITLILLFSSLLIANENKPTVECMVVRNDIEKIVCKVEVERADYDRAVTFVWHTKKYPQDDRERTVVLNANHISVYDYRFLRGRAQGTWNVSITLDDTESQNSAEVDFILEGNTLKY